jgi:hypothetical protein
MRGVAVIVGSQGREGPLGTISRGLGIVGPLSLTARGYVAPQRVAEIGGSIFPGRGRQTDREGGMGIRHVTVRRDGMRLGGMGCGAYA